VTQKIERYSDRERRNKLPPPLYEDLSPRLEKSKHIFSGAIYLAYCRHFSFTNIYFWQGLDRSDLLVFFDIVLDANIRIVLLYVLLLL
jgi:hypothetical protein